ncbi:MAG: glutamate--cysteine ligase [Pseudomonadota bacterium]
MGVFENALNRQQERLQALAALDPHCLAGGLIGLEKECLRVAPDGTISQHPHPTVLGSALTHPWITTDFSEALLELITPPLAGVPVALDRLREIQAYVYRHLGGEILWATSMPCVLAGETNIPIAEYGSSNEGRMKHVYRVGLGHRYGRVMQVIAGVHFNYSLPDHFWPLYAQVTGHVGPDRHLIDESYMALVRNLQRFGWLVPYLFGASPAVCKSFFGGQGTDMPVFDEGTYFEPYATSLRLGDIGYQNQHEAKIGTRINYATLADYVSSLKYAIETPAAEWEALGVNVNGDWRQLNANLLQIENEYYSSVRPKQLLNGLEKPIQALRRRGIRYVELRSPDIDAFHAEGMDEKQLHFLEAFMVFCVLMDSRPLGTREIREIDLNFQRVAHQGRKPGLMLARGGGEVPLRVWASQILEGMSGICETLDAGTGRQVYATALLGQVVKVQDSAATPSARMLAEMRDRGESFYEFARRRSREYQVYFNGVEIEGARVAELDDEAAASLRRQQDIEDATNTSFGEFLADYLAGD